MNTNTTTLSNFTDVLVDEICNSQPLSLSSSIESRQSLPVDHTNITVERSTERPPKGTGQLGQFRSKEEINPKYRDVFSYPYFNLVQSNVIEDALYSDKSIVVCAPTGSGKTVVFEMAIVQLLMELEDKQYAEDFKIIYMAPVKALCTERLTEWYSKFTKLGLFCIEVTGDTDVDFTQLKPYKIIITTPEKWDMLTRRWRDHRSLVEVIKLFLIDEVHILNDETRGPVLEAVVSRMKTIENSAQSVHRIEQLQKEMRGETVSNKSAPRIRFVAVSATISNPEDVANWLGASDKPAVFYKFGDECRPVKLKRIVEGYPCPEGTSIFKFDIILNYKLWPIIQKYHDGKPTLIFCNTRKSVILTAETLSRELTVTFNAEQKAKLTALASSIKNKKLQALVMSGVGCHHAGLLYEERQNIEFAFRNRDLPILITTTTLAMGVNLPAHLVIIKNTQQYVNGAYQEYSISTVLQMVGRAGRPQFDTEATAVIMTRLVDKPRYQSLVGGCEPLQSFLHKRLAENLNSEAALGTVGDVAQCVQWLQSTFLYVRAARDPKKYLGLSQNSPQHLISKKIEELCVKAMNGLASSGLITMDEASCIESTEAGRLMSIFYLDLETMKQIMKIEGTESLERLLVLICESHELADMHLRVDERRTLNTLNRNNAAATIRFPMKGKISTRQMKLNCIIQAVLGCLSIPDPSLNQEAMKIMRITDRVCKCLVTYVTRPDLITQQPQFYSAVLNSIILAKCVAAHLWENSPFVSKQLKGIGPTFSALLASAGKVNFMLLEESHPRDLERIMNKGAPAGNVLRKQVSLLPKYKLTVIPVDEKTVSIQLVLLNQSHLAENMENLTAGDNHKSYIIVGDSNNNLLLLATFKDKDLISVFNGTITHEVRRKHNFEHKIFAHCISSTFVGIDVHSDYSFNDLSQFFGGPATKTQNSNTPTIKKTIERQTCITDTFKERKRKNTDAIEQSKEKEKRENAIIKNFKYLKESFESASKNVNRSMHEQSKQNNDTCTLPSNTINNTPNTLNVSLIDDKLNPLSNKQQIIEDFDSDDIIDDEKIYSILNEIESEMNKTIVGPTNTKASLNNKDLFFRNKNISNPFPGKFKADTPRMLITNLSSNVNSYKGPSGPKKRKLTTPTSNYNFIDLLERNCDLSDDDDKTNPPQKDNGFSDTIKSQIQKYLTKTQTKVTVPDRNVESLLDEPKNRQVTDDEILHELVPVKINSERSKPVQKSYPRYEITEILGGNNRYAKYVKDDVNVTSSGVTKDWDETNKNLNKKQSHRNKIDADSIDTNKTELTPQDTILIDDVTTRSDCHAVEVNNLKNTKLITVDESKVYGNKENTEKKLDDIRETIDVIHVDDDDSANKNKSVVNVIDLTDGTDGIYNLNKTILNKLPANISKDTKSVSTEDINNDPSYSSHNTNEFLKFNEPTETNSTMKACSGIIQTYSNPLFTKITTKSDNKTKRSEVSCNQTHCTKSICKPTTSYPTSPFMNDSYHIYNSMEINNNEQNTEYIKRYIYTSSKIDVCTKQTPDYSVQLIKKVKMDLDITAIVSQKRNSFQNFKSDSEGPRNREPSRNEPLSATDNEEKTSSVENLPLDSLLSYKFPLAERINANLPSNRLFRSEAPIAETSCDLNLPALRSRPAFSTAKRPENNLILERLSKSELLSVDRANVSSPSEKNSIPEFQTYETTFNVKLPLSSNRLNGSEFPTAKNLTCPATEFSRYEVSTREAVSNEEPAFSHLVPTVENIAKLKDRTSLREFKGEYMSCISTSNKNQTDSIATKVGSPEKHEELEVKDDDRIVNKITNVEEIEYSRDNGNRKIKNILQKYSKKLGKNAQCMSKPVTASCSGNSRPITHNPLPVQSKKPFKITEIHKLHATIPETIVECRPEAEKEIIELPIDNNCFEMKNQLESLNISDYKKYSEQKPMEENPEYEFNTDLDLIHPPVNVDFDPSKDFNIDQNMFDPKTLLQCVVHDDNDDIVPPPPQFCDDNIYSPSYDKIEITNEILDSQPFRTPQLDTEYNNSIFNDSFASTLTPCTEIETWNLSQEDYWGPQNFFSTPAQSYTVMRRNNDRICVQSSGISSRRLKLGTFKFSQKNKLKARK